ncbi:MAG TPA: DUF6542 domain-containing protein [Streptosporangiaceae bacterium]
MTAERAVPPVAAAPLRLTGRGAVLGMFAVCLSGILVSGWLGWGPLTGGAFVLGCGLAAGWTRPSDLLTVAVSPPAIFLGALILAKALTSSGGVLLSTTEGTLIALSNTAPWLLAGTALSLIVTCARGLPDNIRAIGAGLRGDPQRKPDRPPGAEG